MIRSVRFLSAVAILLAASIPSRAHPGHEDSVSWTGAPSFFLSQAGSLSSGSVGGVAPTVTPRNSVSITTEGVFRWIKSNGWPDHTPGAFPRRGNPNTARPQSYTFRVSLRPKTEAEPVRRGGWWWGVALNGVPFEPGTAETWRNDPQSGWRYEAATGYLDLGLDEHNAHVQPTGAYHYHALPTGFVERLGGDRKRMLQIGWAADGFPLYTSWAYSDPKDGKSPLRQMKSSYRLKSGPRPEQTDGPNGNYDGRFTQDFEFQKGSGDLDECNGRFGVTPEFPEGTYYYCITSEFPFLPRFWRGVPDESFSKSDRPPGGRMGPGNRPPPPIIGALDTNKDGEIGPDEIAAAPKLLKALDKNSDGKLSGTEIHPGPPPAFPPAP